MVDRPERLAELPADLVHFLRSRGLALAAERRDRGAQAAPVRGIVYTPDQLVGLEAIDELGRRVDDAADRRSLGAAITPPGRGRQAADRKRGGEGKRGDLGGGRTRIKKEETTTHGVTQ